MEFLHSTATLDALVFQDRKTEHRSRRDELVSKFTEGINAARVGTAYKPITKRAVAIRINLNPALARDDGEIELLYKECMNAGHFKKFFWVTNGKVDKK